jgi:hypothetical protein
MDLDGYSDASWDADVEDREGSKKEGRHGVHPYSVVEEEEDKNCTLDVRCHRVVALVLRREEGACHTDAYGEEGKEHEGMDALLVDMEYRYLEEQVCCFVRRPSLQSWREK